MNDDKKIKLLNKMLNEGCTKEEAEIIRQKLINLNFNELTNERINQMNKEVDILLSIKENEINSLKDNLNNRDKKITLILLDSIEKQTQYKNKMLYLFVILTSFYSTAILLFMRLI